MNYSILAGGDRRHLTPAPVDPAPGRRYLGPTETVTYQDRFWDGCEEKWIQGLADHDGLPASHFDRVSRRDPATRPAPVAPVKAPLPRRSGPIFARTGLGLMGTGHHQSARSR